MLLPESAVTPLRREETPDKPVDSGRCFRQLEASDRGEKPLLPGCSGSTDEDGHPENDGHTHA
jgi:hypothetical protein